MAANIQKVSLVDRGRVVKGGGTSPTVNSKIYCKSYLVTDEGKTVQVKDMTGTVVDSGELYNQEIIFSVAPTDKYTIEMLDSNDDVEYTTDIIVNYGSFNEVKLGWTKTTFEGVQQILNAHKETELLSVGMDMDEVTLKYGNIPMQWTIGAINHESGHSVFFVPKWCLPDLASMNATSTNVGGWNASVLRTWLNGEFFDDYLPNNIAALVKTRDILIGSGNASTILTTSSDKIWLPREWELFGEVAYAASTEHSSGHAERFAIFANSQNRVKTHGKNGEVYSWWTCSPDVNNGAYFSTSNQSGGEGRQPAATLIGVLPCFQLTSDD